MKSIVFHEWNSDMNIVFWVAEIYLTKHDETYSRWQKKTWGPAA